MGRGIYLGLAGEKLYLLVRGAHLWGEAVGRLLWPAADNKGEGGDEGLGLR